MAIAAPATRIDADRAGPMFPAKETTAVPDPVLEDPLRTVTNGSAVDVAHWHVSLVADTVNVTCPPDRGTAAAEELTENAQFA